MIKIFVDDFMTDPDEKKKDALERISYYCHGVSTDVEIYSHDERLYFHIFQESLTFPNVVYIENLYISYNAVNLGVMFPDLTKVGTFSSYNNIISFGKIKEIDKFYGYQYIPRKSLGNNMYRFANKETGQKWVIKVNNLK